MGAPVTLLQCIFYLFFPVKISAKHQFKSAWVVDQKRNMTVPGKVTYSTPLTPDRLEKIYQTLAETLPRNTGDLAGLLQDLWALPAVPPGLSKNAVESTTEHDARMIPLIQAIVKEKAEATTLTIPRQPLLTREVSTTDAIQRTREKNCTFLFC